MNTNKELFENAPISKAVTVMAVPTIITMLVVVIYNMADTFFIGQTNDAMQVAAVSLSTPVFMLFMALGNLFGIGGSSAISRALGAGQEERAKHISSFCAYAALGAGVLFMLIFLIGMNGILALIGASENTIGYARTYLSYVAFGGPFIMFGTAFGNILRGEGAAKQSMAGNLIGTVTNIVLDPILILWAGMGVAGAALATILSQLVSCVWVLSFLAGKRAGLHIRKVNLKVDPGLAREITALGMSGFIMQGTNCLVQVVCNATLKNHGGDLYVGIMTVINSVREILSLPVSGLTSGSQPVLGFNYGAKRYDRVCQGIRFTAWLGILYTLLAWLAVISFPRMLLSVFTEDAAMLEAGTKALKLYFFGFFFMSFQFSGQSAFTALGYSRQAIFFSLLRKAVIVAPLTVILPTLGLGVDGVFWAEPISNCIGGLACFLTMYFVLYRKLKRQGGSLQGMQDST